MRAASQTSQPDERPAGYTDKSRSQYPKVSRPQKESANAKILTSPRPPDLPGELEDYLTITEKPHEIFATLQDSRERRLRLLLRRFTNQIQHGCRNPNCEVPTCLSYRKRHATVPVRPYNDVAARALAWRCVEQYADAEKEQGSSNDTGAKRRDKSRIYSNTSDVILCWNEPVVPWYEDLSEISRRKKISIHKKSSEQSSVSNGASMRARSNSSSSNGHITIPLSPSKKSIRNTGTFEKPQRKSLKTNEQIIETNRNEPEHIIYSTKDENEDFVYPNKGAGGHRHVAFAEVSDSQTHQQRAPVKDTASFTQTLYDTIGVKHLDCVRLERRNTQDRSLDDSTPGPNTQNGDENGSDSKATDTCRPYNGGTSAIPRVFTFKILPLSAILWLRSTMPYDVHRSPHRDLTVTLDHGQYSLFARQSFHLCLSKPLTLLNSAKTWHFVHNQPYRMDEDVRKQKIKELALKEKSLLQSLGQADLPQPGGIMVAFGMLIAISSIPEVLNHLFAALQHAYILPSWIQTMQNKSVLPSRDRQSPRDSSQRSASNVETLGSTHATHKSGTYQQEYLDDHQVAQVCFLVVLALQLILALKPQSFIITHQSPSKDFGEQYSQGRKAGVVFPHASLHKAWSKDVNVRPNYQAYAARLDTMDEWSFQRLLDGFTDVISHRLAVAETEKTTLSGDDHTRTVIDHFMDELLMAVGKPDTVLHKQTLQLNLVDVLRSVVSRRWDRGAIVRKSGPIGGALELLAAIYRKKTELGIRESEFQWKFISDAFDNIEMPLGWLDFREDNAQTHILSYAFLFEPASLVVYFRAINSIMMKKSHEYAASVHADARLFLRDMRFPVYGAKEVLTEIRPNMAKFFVLTIRRQNMLQDALNQIWRRQKQELLRPLKVRLGRDEGEDGLDHGGVQAEFFRLIFAEALNPNYGMFTIDERTRMTWFQPGSLEPLHKFEALGILLSLAVYNGITLPVTFPTAFYRKLLGLKVKSLQHIQDGWPDLTRGLQQLLDWKDGDVGEVIARTYEFSYEAFGTSCTVDMTKVDRDDLWPPIERSKSKEKMKTTSFDFGPDTETSPTSDERSDSRSPSMSPSVSPARSLNVTDLPTSARPAGLKPYVALPSSDNEAPLVTNANRVRYVKDYVYWLTDKSISRQWTSFAQGFFTCIDRTALSIFTPEHLKTVIEGHQHIDIDGLQSTTTYDDYKSTDEVIVWFWQVVRNMSPKQHRKLLEFVTASDRVPVNGIDSIVFIIQRNGEGDERLPSSSTCYGRLLLPRYSSKTILHEKLEKAVENSIGFGSL